MPTTPQDEVVRHSPAAERNQGPILAALLALLPPRGSALEIASGTGQHACHFAAAMPQWRWQPSDADAGARASIAARVAQAGVRNVSAPLHLDVAEPDWRAGTVDAIYCANLLHIAPWAACAALMQGAARHLAGAGLLIVYGPFFAEGEVPAPGNVAFDADLRARDTAWGVRQLAEVARAAANAGLTLRERLAMPANNLLLVFERGGAGGG
jgi:hypothetical protein